MEIDVNTCRYRIGLLKFGSNALVQFHLRRYENTPDLLTAIDNVGYSYGFTATAQAIKEVRENMFTRPNGDRKNVRNIAVLMTDGLSNVRQRQTMTEVRRARNQGIHIVPLGVTSKGKDELRQMATDKADGAFFVPSFHVLSTVRENVTKYLLEGKPSYIRGGSRNFGKGGVAPPHASAEGLIVS